MDIPDDVKIYTVVVNGVEYKSTSPITASQVRQKNLSMSTSGAFDEDGGCEDCGKETTEDNLVKW